MTARPGGRPKLMVLPRLLAAALLAAACSDSIGPAGPAGSARVPAAPQSDFSPNGIQLDQQNSAMGEFGRRLVKGFNPTNPQNGDAIVVTLFWVGSTNIVDSVTDHLVNSAWTRVGNTYRLVDYVTAGGISMATFVATNVQNIPLANSNGEDVLAIEASLSDSVVDGGIWMSAWRGVEDVSAQALGPSSHGSGAGAAPTAAHPGTVTTVNPGALVFGVTMSRPPVGVDPPAGFTNIDPFGSIADAFGLKADARYAVRASAGSVDPTWTWFYDQTHAGTWLASALVLNAATSSTNQYPTASFTASCSGMTCTFNSSASSDPDGTIASYNWSFGDGSPIVTTPNPSHLYGPSGSFVVSLTVRDNQGATHSTQRTVTVPASTSSGNLNVTTSTSGSNLDPDGYTITVDGGSPQAIGINGSVTYTGLTAASHTVAISGVAANCTVTGGTSQAVTVPAGGTATATFTVTCTATNQLPVASFTSSCTTLTCNFTSTSSDPDGTIAAYSWNFGDGSPAVTTQNASHTYAAAGTYTVTLTVTDNQGATNSSSQSVTVAAANQPPVASFTSSCTTLTCNFTSTSSDPDGTIAAYSWNFGDGSPAVTTQNASHSYGTGGTYTVTLTVTDNQGATNSVSQSVTVAPANQPPVANFTSSCTTLTCNFTSTSSDPDGTIAAYSWTFGDGGTSTLPNPSHSYSIGGTYTVTLTVTDNQGATNSTSQSVTVTPPNQPPVAAFTSSCSALSCSFTNSSSDPDGSIASNSWTFGDGGTSTVLSPSHTYATGGTYTVTLTVTDNQGATNSVSHTVTVTPPNQPPTAAFTSSCSGDACTFTNTSSDPDGSIASNSWTFGDGGTSTVLSPSHTYVTGGTYTVTLTVTDNQGATNSVSQNVTVNRPPTAAFTSSCSALSCSFTNSSSDPDGSIASNSWTFGDGGTSTVLSPSHSYATGGTYTVTLTVTDNQGATNSVSHTVTVTPPNQPPVSSFTKSCIALACTFTSTSSDPDGTIASYRWTFGDGSPAVTTQNASHTYAAGGTYTVTLQVTDNQGATNSSSQSVTVTAPNQAPVVNAGPDQTVLLGVLYTTSFSFSDPDNGPWTYTVDWGDGSTSSGSLASAGSFSASHTYLGLLTQRTIRVTVTDSKGASGSDTRVITLIL